MIPLPPEESDRRISKLQEYLGRADIGCGCVLNNVDRFYYTGTMQDGVLLVPAEGEPVLFVRRTLSRALEESPLAHIVGLRSLGEIRDYVQDNGISCRSMAMDLDVVPARLYLGFQNLFPESGFEDLSPFVRGQRAVKSPFELSLMMEAGRRFDLVLTQMREEMRPGMSEYQVYARFVSLLLEHHSSLLIRTRMFNMEAETRYILSGSSGAKRSAMDSPTAAGSGISYAFPSGSGMKKIGAGEPILIDSVFVHEGYQIDCTRVYAFGELDSRLTRAHALSLQCHELFRSEVRAGVSIPDLYNRVWGFVEEQGFAEVFMGVKFIGHGVGLELDEFPVLTPGFEDNLVEGMTVAFEPKFLFPQGTVGSENTYRVLESGVESLNRMDEGIQYL
jgi:Xaa-Pro aminopeptidase